MARFVTLRAALTRCNTYTLLLILALVLWAGVLALNVWSAVTPNVDVHLEAHRVIGAPDGRTIEIVGYVDRNRSCPGTLLSTWFHGSDGRKEPAPRSWHPDSARVGKSVVDMYDLPVGRHFTSVMFTPPDWAIAVEFRVVEPPACHHHTDERRVAWVPIPERMTADGPP